MKTCFAKIAEQDHMQLRRAKHYHNTPQVTFYASTVAVRTTFLANVANKTPTTTGKKPRSTPRDLRETGPRKEYHRMGPSPSGESPTVQILMKG